MATISHVSVHERDDGERRIKAGKGKPSHDTVRIPTPDNGLEDITSESWERLAVFKLPHEMPKSDFPEWWNEHLRSDDEPEVIDQVLRLMGERGGEE